MRRFHLVRTTDVTGVSGTGVVAHGCQFDDGTTVIRWLGQRPSTVVWATIEDAFHVHGHAASTQFRWLDNEDQAVTALDPAQVWIVPRVDHDWSQWSTHGQLTTAAGCREDAGRLLAVADYLDQLDQSDRQAARVPPSGELVRAKYQAAVDWAAGDA